MLWMTATFSVRSSPRGSGVTPGSVWTKFFFLSLSTTNYGLRIHGYWKKD